MTERKKTLNNILTVQKHKVQSWKMICYLIWITQNAAIGFQQFLVSSSTVPSGAFMSSVPTFSLVFCTHWSSDPTVPLIHQRTGRGGWGGWGGCSPPCRKKISIIRAKLMYRSGKDTVKNILLFNILIYLFSSRNSPNPLSDLCTTSRDGCYYSELEHWVLPRD